MSLFKNSNISMAKQMSSIHRLPVVLRLLLVWIGDSNSLILDGLWSQPSKISTPSRPYALHETSWSRKLAVHRAAATTWRALSSTTSIREALAESAAPVIEESSKGGISSRKFVVVARGKARLFWEGNPLVFGGSIAREEGNPMVGDIVDVVDASGKFIAWGVYNPDSMYRVRVLAREGEPLAETRDVETLVRARISTARDTRRAIGLPSADTNTYRLVNGEGDRLSGLVVDVFDNMIGVSSSAVWVERFRPEIEAALRLELGANQTEIVWRRSDGRLQQDGWKGINKDFSVDAGGHGGEQEPGVGDITVKSGTRAEGGAMDCADWSKEGKREGVDGNGVDRCVVQSTVVRELGLEYEVRLQLGQKTGFYCDQRESRDAMRKLSQGRTVLDMFCYSGGFALNAAIGGALRVLAVDSSQPALEEARINAARNRLDRVVEFVREDALVFMKRAASNGDRFGVVVLDPPKLAPNKKSMANATSRYRRLNAAALELVEQGGILATFTCSAAMTQSGTFVGVVQSAAASVGRTLTLLRTVGPAADHVTNPCYPEGAYLMGAFFYVS